MKKKELKILKNSINLLRRKDYIPIDNDILNEKFSNNVFSDYLMTNYLKKLEKDESNKIIKSLNIYKYYYTVEPCVFGTVDNFKINVPQIINVRHALINIHEFMHAISLVKGNEYSIYEEIIPYEAERRLLNDFNIEYDLVSDKINYSIFNAKGFNEENSINHIYASLILLENNEIDLKYLFDNKEKINKNIKIDKKIYKLLKA